MIQVFLSIVLVAFLVRGVAFLIRRHVARAARGKTIDNLIAERRVPQDVADTAAQARTWRAERARGGFPTPGGEGAIRTRPRPRLSKEQRVAVLRAELKLREEYLATMKLGFYQCVFIFLGASVAGLVLETAWMYASVGLLQSRVGFVWGPFSPLYGAGALLLTIVCWNLRRHEAPDWLVFLVSSAIGGSLEQATGMVMNGVFRAQSWTYLGLPDAITQWVAWRFLFAWGMIGLIWCRFLMPEMLYRIGMPKSRRQMQVAILLAVYIVADAGMTVACFTRKAARDQGVPATTPFEQWVDEHYSDRFIAERFENVAIGHDLGPNL